MNRVSWFAILVVIWLEIIISHSQSISQNGCIKTDEYCHCDDKCRLYNDCCYGHEDFNKPIITNTENNYKCGNSEFENIRIVTDCTNKYSDYASLCKQLRYHPQKPLLNLIPVISNDDKRIYLNKFCAICNQVKLFQYLKSEIRCSQMNLNLSAMNNEMLQDKKSCKLHKITSKHKRYCNKIVRSCSDSFFEDWKPSLRNDCTTGIFMKIRSNTLTYRNPSCCQCNNDTCYTVFAMPMRRMPSLGIFDISNWDDTANNDETNATINNSMSNSTNTTNNDTFGVISYFSLVFQLISLTSLIFLIILYTIKPIFHNFGGYLTICLSTNLSIYYLLTIILILSNIESTYCTLFGILRHFHFICNFIWMSLYALDLLQTFGLKSVKSKSKSLKVFMIYFGAGLSVGLLIILGAVLSEYLLEMESKWRPKYGGSNCWFTNIYGGMVWFYIPVCLMLLWNMITSIIVFYKLYKTSVETRMIKKRGESNSATVWLCIRLTSVFGVVYIMSVIAALSKIYALMIISALLMDLQGLFLAICFCWAKKVRRVVTTTLSSFSSVLTKGNFSRTTETNVESNTAHSSNMASTNKH